MTEWKEIRLAATIALTILAIFVFDIVMVPDHVSSAFMYTVPIFLSIGSRYRVAHYYAIATTILSVAGIFPLPPESGASFYANRTIAILAQWIVAALVLSRRSTEQALSHSLQMQREKAERQRRFIDVLSHEIGTSLTTIDGHAFRLSRRSTAPTAAEIAQRSLKIKASVRHIEALIQHIQLVDEVEQHLMPKCAAVSIKPMVIEVAQQIRQTYPQASIQIEIDELPAALWADPFMVRQIVENIVSNAAKYSSAGSPIVIEGHEAEGCMILRVSDKGRGIPQDEVSRVFAVYYRASNSRGVHGSGVGLYVSQQFAAAHGGAITIDSQLGHGTTVTVRIPVVTPEAD